MRKLSYAEFEELNVSSMYWAMEMEDALRENMKAVNVGSTIEKLFGTEIKYKLEKLNDSTFNEVYELGKKLRDEILLLDDTNDMYKVVTFNVVEDVLFNIGEVVITYERVYRIGELLGDTDDLKSWMNQIGANICGYVCE